jgi:tripartite-type tricarboxylate transporter receptor subunit TctC
MAHQVLTGKVGWRLHHLLRSRRHGTPACSTGSRTNDGIDRFKSIIIGLALLLLAGAMPANDLSAQAYPSRPVRWIVPFNAGGPGDGVLRIIAPKLSEALGQQVVVDNRGGANGIVGTEIVKHAAPDGYTLLLVSAAFSINATLYPKLPYDSLNDFAPVATICFGPGLLVVHPSLPVKTLTELIALAKAKPGSLSYASSGTGAPSHLAVELIKTMAGIDMVHVPYRSMAPGITELLGGHVQLSIPTISAAVPHVKAGKLRALGVTSAQRSTALPEVPTIAEAGLPGFEASNWYALLAPAGTPAEIVVKLNSELNRILKMVDVRDRLAFLGLDARGMTTDEFGTFMKTEIAKWAKVIRASKARPDQWAEPEKR